MKRQHKRVLPEKNEEWKSFIQAIRINKKGLDEYKVWDVLQRTHFT